MSPELSLEVDYGGGLLLPDHVTALTRRDVIYSYSAFSILGRSFPWRLKNEEIKKIASLRTSDTACLSPSSR